MNHIVYRSPFIEVDPSREESHTTSAERADDQFPGVALHRGGREAETRVRDARHIRSPLHQATLTTPENHPHIGGRSQRTERLKGVFERAWLHNLEGGESR